MKPKQSDSCPYSWIEVTYVIQLSISPVVMEMGPHKDITGANVQMDYRGART